MGFLGDMFVKGVAALCGEEAGEVFAGDGIGEKKALFEKMLKKWDEIFQREDFFNNSTFSKLEETAKLPVFLQTFGCEPEKGHKDDFKKAEQNSEIKLTRIKLDNETVDFACINKLYYLTEYGRIEECIRPFYYFRYTKGSNTITFRYTTYMKGDQLNGYKKTDMDILSLSFQTGKEITETSIRWQPEVTVEGNGSTPLLFFNKINHKNVYLNLNKFLKNLKVPTHETAVKQDEEAKELAWEAKQRREEARYKQLKNQEEKKKRKIYSEMKNKWKETADELLSEFKAESALDDFLGSDSSGGNGLFKEKRAKLAEEYFHKGEKARTTDEKIEAFGIAAELGSISAKREIGKELYTGLRLLQLPSELKIESVGLNILNQLAKQGDVDTIEWLRKKHLPCPEPFIDHNDIVKTEDNPIKVVDSEKQEQILEQQKIAKEYITYQIKTLCFIFGWHTNASDEDIGRIAYFGNILYKGNDLEAEKLAKEEIERIRQCQTEEDCFKWLFDFAPTDIIAISGSLYATCFCALAKEYSDKLQKNQQVENEEHFMQSCKNFCALRKILSIDEFDEQKMSMSPSCQKAYSEFALAIRGSKAEIATEEDFLKIIKNIGEEK